MSITVPIALVSWPAVVLLLFAVLKPRHAVIASFLFAWLFLPMAGYRFEGLPNYGKMEATCYGVLLGIFLFDAGRLGTFRPRWIDLPIAILCLTPMASSITNGLGPYDGVSGIFGAIVTWGLPWFIGRLYFNDLEGLRELAIGVFLGGLIYVPFVLFEARMSPQLHTWVYGFHQHTWGQTMRFGGWRPTVFMQHGLAVGLWMAITGLVGFWLWWTGALRSLWKVPMNILVPGLIVTAVICRSFGAIALMIIGIGALLGTRVSRLKIGLAALILAPVMYMGVRAPGIWDGSHLLDAVSVISTEERVGSLLYRLDAEDILAAHAMRQPLFGWGGWGRNRPAVMGEDDPDMATDGLWVITLGVRGIVGLAAMSAVILLPVVLFWYRLPAAAWWHPATAPAAALSMVLILFMIDSLFNAMLNPIYLLAAGGLGGWLAVPAMRRRAQAAMPQHAHAARPPAPYTAAHPMRTAPPQGPRA